MTYQVENRFQSLPFKCNLQRYIPGVRFVTWTMLFAVRSVQLVSSAWSVSEYVFGVRAGKLTRHLGVKSLSTCSKEYAKQTRH
jgi:hypothetical protein